MGLLPKGREGRRDVDVMGSERPAATAVLVPAR